MKSEIFETLSKVDWAEINAEYFTHMFYDAIKALATNCTRFSKSEVNDNEIIEKSKEVELKSDFHYKIQENLIIKKIVQNIKESQNWAKEISFKDSIHSKDTKKIFVPLDFYLTPKRTHFDASEPKKPLNEIDFSLRNLIILGGPGAGKTTLMKKLFLDELSKDIEIKNF